MNADEIVKRLREYASRCDGTHSCWNAPTLNVAADLIEGLQARLVTLQSDIDRKIGECEGLREGAEVLKAQLVASQRRERAAVEDMKIVVETASECNVCKHRVGVSGCPIRYKECNFEWRGQEAGKGEAK